MYFFSKEYVVVGVVVQIDKVAESLGKIKNESNHIVLRALHIVLEDKYGRQLKIRNLY